MIYISRYLTKAEKKNSKKNELIALKFALNPGETMIDTSYVSPHEKKTLEQLKGGTYAESYKGNNRKVIDDRYKAQREFERWIENTTRQTRREALEKLRDGLILILIIIGFIVFLYFAHQNSPNTEINLKKLTL